MGKTRGASVAGIVNDQSSPVYLIINSLVYIGITGAG